MTRTVGVSARMMQVLSRADARASMNLPPNNIDWSGYDVGADHLKGLRIGLLLDAGCGLAVEPEVRAAVEQAARMFEEAGAIVEPMQPFMSQAMLDGMDHLWRMRSHVDMQALRPEQRARVLPYIRDWAESARRLRRRACVPRLQPVPRDARGSGRGLRQVRLCDFPRGAEHAGCRGRSFPYQRPAASARTHRLHRSLQHVGATGGVRQLRLQRGGGPADRACRSPGAALRRPGCVLRVVARVRSADP